MKKVPTQAYILLLVLALYYWPWQLFSGDIGWLVTVVSVSFIGVIACNKLTNERWATGVIIVEVLCMMINATLFLFGMHKVPMQEHIMISAFIIELLIITMSLGAGVGRIRNDGLHNYLNGVGSLFNYSRSNHSGKEIA